LQTKRGSGRQKTAGRLLQSIEKFKMRFAKNISRAQAPSDPLPPWNDGAAKKVITDFLGRVGNGLRASNMAYYWSGADLHRPRPDTRKVRRAPQSLLQSLFAMEICT
jgi:hypothetical protein